MAFLHNLIAGTTAPTITGGVIWLDTTAVPNVIKIYNGTTWVTPFAASITAIDGLSVDGSNNVVLGQTVGQSGNPAKLLQNREIPLNGFTLQMTGSSSNFVVGADGVTYTFGPVGLTTRNNNLILSPNQPNFTNFTGTGNVGVGLDQAFQALTTGAKNVAVGDFSSIAMTTGSGNIGIGFESNQGITTGSYNVAAGYQALQFITTTNYNIGIGSNSAGTAAGIGNIVLGSNTPIVSSSTETYGNYNIIIGFGAQSTHNTTDNNIVLGNLSYTTGTTNTTIIGNSIHTSTSNIVLLGSGSQKVIAASSTAAVDLTPATLQSYGSFSIQTSDSLYVNSFGFNNTFSVFSSAGSNRVLRVGSNFNTYFGYLAGGATGDMTSVTAFGYNVFGAGTNTGQNNTAFGVNNLQGNTSGTDNLAVGVNAGYNNTTGSFNIFFGTSAGFQLSTGSQNTLVGVQTFISTGPFHNNNGVTGSNNTAIGYNAGGGGLSFTVNTTTIDNSVMIGYQTGPTSQGANITNVTLIGNDVNTNLSNVAVIGRGDQNILLGYGTATADNGARLQIAGGTSVTATVSSASTLTINDTAGVWVASGTTSTWTLPAITGNTGKTYTLANRGSGTVTVNSNAGGNDIYTTSASNTYSLTANSIIIIVNDGTYWFVK